MGTVVPSPSRNRRFAFVGVTVLLVAGCAASAPPLPADTTSINRTQSIALDAFSKQDAALSCDQIAVQLQDLDQQMREANGRIEGNRTQNQVAGYFGSLLFLPLLVATEGNQTEKDEITRLYGRRDTLIKLAAVKECKSGS